MLCERCKIREANIQYTEVINGIKTDHNFCAQCAKEMDFGQYSAIFDGDFPLAKLLSSLLNAEETNPRQEGLQQVICPTCKTSYTEFIKNSQFGCADCYGVFDLLIGDNMKQLQGSEVHTGKKPRYQEQEAASVTEGESLNLERTIEEQIDFLDAKLKNAVKMEEYEAAARCRDEIKELKERNKTDA